MKTAARVISITANAERDGVDLVITTTTTTLTEVITVGTVVHSHEQVGTHTHRQRNHFN